MNTLVIDIIDTCNLQCSYCFGPINSSKQLSKEKILEKIKNSDMDYIVLTGGEPLLHKDIENIILEIFNLNKKIILHTNGMLLTEKFIKENQKHLYRINLPLDSINIQINAKHRGENHLDKILTILETIKKYKIKLSISTVFTKFNQDNIFELADFLEKINPSLWRIFEFKNVDNKKELKCFDPDQEKINNFTKKINEYNFPKVEFIPTNSDFYKSYN